MGGGFEWTSGAKHNFPEARCCACGGGSIAGAVPSAAVRPSHAATQHDTARRSAAALGLNALQAVAVMQQAVVGAQRACYDSEGWTNGHGLGCAEYSALRYARRCNARCNMQRSDADGGAPAPMIDEASVPVSGYAYP